jgi:hypothetical protein
VSFLLISKQFLQTEKTALYQNGFIHKTQLIKIRDKFGRVVERNAINEFIFEFEDGFSNADNSANVIGNNQLRNFGI